MKKFKQITDIAKGFLALVIIIGSIPFIIYPVVWYFIKCFNIFF